MEIEIRKLSPELAEEYVRFFDNTPHDDGIDEHKCYCVGFCGANHRMETDYSAREKRRELAYDYVRRGLLQGYLAYAEGRAVGWCNANTKSDCADCGGSMWLRSMAANGEMDSAPNDKVKAIYCFVVAPEMKRQGIAKSLLRYACRDAADNGFDYVEAYPEKETANELDQFMGFVALYQDLGFAIHEETERKYIMRKPLK